MTYIRHWSAKILFATTLLTLISVAARIWLCKLSFLIGSPSKAVALFFYFDRYFVESLGVAAVCIFLMQYAKFGQRLAQILLAIFALVTTLQTGAIFFGGEFVSDIAMENLDSISLIFNASTACILILSISLAILLPVVCCRQSKIDLPAPQIKQFAVALFFTGLFLQQGRYWIPTATAEARNDLLRRTNASHSSPLLAAVQLFLPRKHTGEIRPLGPRDREILASLGLYAGQDRTFPFIHTGIYHGKVPFPVAPALAKKRPNILLIFTEGFSARTTSVYSHNFPAITPNLEAFAETSMVVENYYNHTAPTLRGLLGQLCSVFPVHDSANWDPDKVIDTHYTCLTDFLSSAGYKTSFLNPHAEGPGVTDDLMRRIRFGEVLSGDQLSKRYLGNEALTVRASLSDHQLYRSLKAFMQEQEKLSDQNIPFFAAMYSLETHAGIDTGEDGVPYGDRKNNALNTVHNLDDAFGQFWEYFRQTELAKNTVIIFTSDHAHYTETTYVDAIKDPDYQSLFIDRVPLIIHDGRQTLPRTYNRGITSSIDLAPSLTQYLGLTIEGNAMLGRSMFDDMDGPKWPMAVAMYGDTRFVIDAKRIHYIGNSKEHGTELDVVDRYISLYQQKEELDLVWK